MEIVEGRKKCCLVEMRMIDADTECCSKIMVIGSRMSSFVEKGEKKKKTIFPPAHLFSYPLFVTFRWPRLLSGVSILSWIERLPIAHHHHSLVSLFLYLTAVWCDVAFEPMENGGEKKKKKGRTNEKKKQYARRWKAMFFLCWYDNRGMDVEARFDLPSWINIKPIRTLIRDGMDDGSTAEPTVNTRARSSYALLFVPVRFNKTKARILDWTSAVARIWVATGKKIEESVQGKIIESDSIIVEITQLDTKPRGEGITQ